MPVGVDMGKGNWNLLGSSGVQWENSEHAQKISSGIQRSRKDFTITWPNPEVWFLFILFSFVTWNQIPFHPSGCRRPTKALLATWHGYWPLRLPQSGTMSPVTRPLQTHDFDITISHETAFITCMMYISQKHFGHWDSLGMTWENPVVNILTPSHV